MIDSASSFVSIDTLNSTDTIFVDSTFKQTYPGSGFIQYRLFALNDSSASDFSNTVQFNPSAIITPPPVLVPVNLRLNQINSSKIQLYWTNKPDNVKLFIVQRKIDSVSSF